MASQGIPWPYRAFMLWFEPLSALNGAYLAAFKTGDFLRIISPPAYPHPATPPPTETLALTQLASLYVLFAFNEGVILRYVGQGRRDIWRLVVIGCFFGDVGHMYALWRIAVDTGATNIFLDPRLWTRWEEWGNLGLTWVGLILRLCFLLGVGF